MIRARIAGLQAAATADAAPPDRIRVTAPATVPDELTQILGTTGRFDIVPLGSTQLETGMQVDEARFQPLFAGDQVDTLASGQDQSGQPTLEISLTPQATTAFANYTRDHVGDFLAIVLDGSVLSAPVINAPITDGHISITSGAVGGFDPATVRKLAVVVETGPLPYPLVEVAHTP